MKVLLFAVLATTILLAACGGGGSGVGGELHILGTPWSASDYRDAQRARLVAAGAGGVTECTSLRGLTGEAAFKAIITAPIAGIVNAVGDVDASKLDRAQLEQRLAEIGTAQAMVAVLATVEKSPDAARAGAIIQEECARVLNDQ